MVKTIGAKSGKGKINKYSRSPHKNKFLCAGCKGFVIQK